MAESNFQRQGIGPGVVVLVVGPSGAGKDALLQGAAAELQTDTRIVFPKRIISRPAHAAEDHERASYEDMIESERSAAYALSWRAHGLVYALPSTIDDSLRAGSTVVFNASRTVVGSARARYQHVTVLYVEAPSEVRAARLAVRGRETETEIAERLAREVRTFSPSDADVVIQNDGSLQHGVDRLAGAIRQITVPA